MALMFAVASDGPLGSQDGNENPHLAWACGVPHRHPGWQARLHRSVSERQSEVPAGRGRARARRRDLHHARPRRPLRRHDRAGREVRLHGGGAGRARRLAAAEARGRERARSEQGRHGRARRRQGHAHARAALVEHERRDVRGRALRPRRRAGGRLQALLRRRHERLRRHGPDRADLRAGARRAADRRPLHDGSARGCRRARAARREALRAVPLRHLPASSTGTPEQLRELAPGVEILAPEPGGTVEL